MQSSLTSHCEELYCSRYSIFKLIFVGPKSLLKCFVFPSKTKSNILWKANSNSSVEKQSLLEALKCGPLAHSSFWPWRCKVRLASIPARVPSFSAPPPQCLHLAIPTLLFISSRTQTGLWTFTLAIQPVQNASAVWSLIPFTLPPLSLPKLYPLDQHPWATLDHNL